MKTIHIVCVGKLKDKNILELENEYLKRISGKKVILHEVKSSPLGKSEEGKDVLSKIKSLNTQSVILLEERGSQYNSDQFSEYLESCLKNDPAIVFVIGGAEGHGENVLSLEHKKLSLSKMTFPHRLARLLLIEQIYRGLSILDGHPYHK